VFDDSNPREVCLRSPLAYATSFKCPVQLYFGELETALAAGTRLTAERAQAHILDVEAVMVPGDHFTVVPEEIRLAIAFFQKK
jgi:hypothetical protein